MAKLPFKTFTKNDANTLKKIVRDFNKKRNYVSKTIPGQPSKILYSEIISNVSSRAEFNRVKAVYSRYLRKGAERPIRNESGVVTTRWLRNENRYALQRINNQRAAQRKHYESLPGDLRKRAYEELGLIPKKDFTNTITTKTYLNRYFKGLQTQANPDYFDDREERYKKNYLKALRDELSGTPGFRKLYDQVKSIDGQTLLEAVSRSPTFEINFIYGFEEGEIRTEYLLEQWEYYLK